jgi:dipeptidase E
MKKLFLTSSGLDTQKITEEFLLYIGKTPQKVKIAFIPTAADPEPNKSYMEAEVQRLKDLDFQLEMFDLKEKNPETIKSELSEFDVIYVNGGNTFYLLYWFNKSGLTQVISELLENTEKIYVGISAGSIIAGPNIELAGWKPAGDRNDINIQNLKGLGLIDIAIFPHYKNEFENIIKEEIHKVSYSVELLKDGEAIITTSKGIVKI